MRILFLIPELGYGGAETALLRLASELAKGNDVTIAVFRRSYQVGNYAEVSLDTSFPVVELDSPGRVSPIWIPSQLARWWRRARELARLKRNCDVCISFLGGANLLNSLVLCGKPCVLSERGSKRQGQSGNPISRWIWCSFLDPLAYRRADRVVCVSESLGSEIRQALPLHKRQKVLTIAGYLDPKMALSVRQAPIEPELLSLANRPLLVTAGRLDRIKGFQNLLPIFAQVASSVPSSGLLLIGDGPQQLELIRLTESLGLTVSVNEVGKPMDLNGQVIFLGYRPNPARYTNIGRAFVMPSLWEGLPNMLLEALAAGSWTLASDCGGCAEILISPELGCLLPPIQLATSREPWITALNEALLYFPPRQVSTTNRQKLVDRFSIQRSALHWEALLEELVG